MPKVPINSEESYYEEGGDNYYGESNENYNNDGYVPLNNSNEDDFENELASLEKGISSVEEKNKQTDEKASKTFEMEIKQTQEVDERSIYVGNVDYSTTAKDLKEAFSDCGTINRITIPTNKDGSPKGFAYIEFMEKDHVLNAITKDNISINGRELIVKEKRTNIPGMKRGGFRGGSRGGFRGRGGSRGRGFRGGSRGRGFRGSRGGYRSYHHQPY